MSFQNIYFSSSLHWSRMSSSLLDPLQPDLPTSLLLTSSRRIVLKTMKTARTKQIHKLISFFTPYFSVRLAARVILFAAIRSFFIFFLFLSIFSFMFLIYSNLALFKVYSLMSLDMSAFVNLQLPSTYCLPLKFSYAPL